MCFILISHGHMITFTYISYSIEKQMDQIKHKDEKQVNVYDNLRVNNLSIFTVIATKVLFVQIILSSTQHS